MVTVKIYNTGLDQRSALDWIRTVTNFLDFGLDPDCKMHHKFRTELMEKNYIILSIKSYIFSIFEFYLDLDLKLHKFFGLRLDLD